MKLPETVQFSRKTNNESLLSLATAESPRMKANAASTVAFQKRPLYLCLIFLPFNHKASLREHGERLRAALGPLVFLRVWTSAGFGRGSILVTDSLRATPFKHSIKRRKTQIGDHTQCTIEDGYPLQIPSWQIQTNCPSGRREVKFQSWHHSWGCRVFSVHLSWQP